jgi:hypothetical protein
VMGRKSPEQETCGRACDDTAGHSDDGRSQQKAAAGLLSPAIAAASWAGVAKRAQARRQLSATSRSSGRSAPSAAGGWADPSATSALLWGCGEPPRGTGALSGTLSPARRNGCFSFAALLFGGPSSAAARRSLAASDSFASNDVITPAHDRWGPAAHGRNGSRCVCARRSRS